MIGNCVECNDDIVIRGPKIRCKLCQSKIRRKAQKHQYDINRERYIEKVKENYLENREERLEYYKEYNKTKRIRTYNYDSVKAKIYRDKNKLSMFCRNALSRVLSYKCIKKQDRTYILLGYTSNILKDNIESKFRDGMSWDNYGKWHIDHIIPISKFKKDTDIKIINSLDNLQPEWMEYNLSKSNKISNIPFCYLYKNKKYIIC